MVVKLSSCVRRHIIVDELHGFISSRARDRYAVYQPVYSPDRARLCSTLLGRTPVLENRHNHLKGKQISLTAVPGNKRGASRH